MHDILGITGTPGTGKKTLSPIVASELSYSILDLNGLAKRQSKGGSTSEVDTAILRRKIVRIRTSGRVAFGHLLPHVFRAGELDFVAVLRCEPDVLKDRLVARGYRGRKLQENLEAELIGVVLDDSIRSFGESAVHEYDSTRLNPLRLARRIASDYANGVKHAPSWIDWTTLYASSARLRSLFSLGRTEPAST